MKFYGCLLLILSCISAAEAVSDKDFIAKYEVDDSIKEILDDHADDIAKALKSLKGRSLKRHAVWTFDWLPDYFVKYNLARIYGMEKMKRAAEAHNLDLVRFPDKRIYHVKGKPQKLDSAYYAVVIKKVEEAKNLKPLNLNQAKQLCALIRATSYCSMTKTNYIRTANDTVTMIDTESTFDKDRVGTTGFMRLVGGGHDLNKDYSPEALKYILSQLVNATLCLKQSEIYKEVLRNFERQKGPKAWNYKRYFEGLVNKKSVTEVKHESD